MKKTKKSEQNVKFAISSNKSVANCHPLPLVLFCVVTETILLLYSGKILVKRPSGGVLILVKLLVKNLQFFLKWMWMNGMISIQKTTLLLANREIKGWNNYQLWKIKREHFLVVLFVSLKPEDKLGLLIYLSWSILEKI